MLGVSIVDVYRALGFPAIYEVYSYYGTRNLALPEQVSRVYTVIGNGNVSLNWEPSFTDGKPRLGYVIEYVDQQPIARLYVPWIVYSDKYPLTNITITGLTNGTTYYFRVAAINVVGVGKYSDVVTSIPGTRPDAVSTLFINISTTNTFIAEWTDPYNQGYPIDNYTIRYRKSVSNPPVNPPDTTWLDTTNITVITFQSNDSLISRIVRGTTNVLSYPIPISSPLETDLYEFQISGSNVLGTSDFKNTAPVTNTTLPDPQSMTVLPPNVGWCITWKGFHFKRDSDNYTRRGWEKNKTFMAGSRLHGIRSLCVCSTVCGSAGCFRGPGSATGKYSRRVMEHCFANHVYGIGRYDTKYGRRWAWYCRDDHYFEFNQWTKILFQDCGLECGWAWCIL